MQGSNSKEWLIKSSGEIKGPYTFEEIAQGIASREFILVDEISKKFSRWKYLRDEVTFDHIIAEHKNREYSKNEKTFTSSGTDTLTEEITGKVLNFQGSEKLLSNVEEHLRENEEARATSQQNATDQSLRDETASSKIPLKSYGSEADLKKKSDEKNIFVRVTIILVIILGFVYFAMTQKKEKVLSYDDIKKIAYDDINYGNFEEAKVYLEKALAVNSTNEELKYLLSYVSIELDDNLTAQRYIDDLKKKAVDPKIKAQVSNLAGVLQLKNFNLDEAKKNLELALKQNPKYPAAFFNRGVANYLENKFEAAHRDFAQSLIYGGLDGNILLSMVEMAARFGPDLKNDPEKTRQADDILDMIGRQSRNLYAYRQELKIGAAYLYHFLGDNQKMEEQLDEAVNIDPLLTSDHMLDTSYYRGLVTWDRLTIWIKKMRDAHPSSANLRTLYGYALFKGSDKLKGKDIVEGLLNSNVLNTSNQVILTYIYMTLKRDDVAKVTLDPIMHNRDKSLPFTLMGRLCLQKKDYPCADLNFSEALRIDKGNISASAGLARVSFEQKDYKKAKELVTEVFRVSPGYKPILQIKKRLGALTN